MTTDPSDVPAPANRGIGLSSWFRFYVGIPAAAIYLFCFALFWRPIAEAIFQFASFSKEQGLPDWVPSLLFNVFSDVLAALLIAFGVIAVFRSKNLQSVARTYRAFELDGDTKVAWGEVTLRYELLPTGFFEPQFRCRLTNSSLGIELFGSATYTKDQYLVGHYREIKNLARRRAGAFVMRLNGEGTAFEGTYSFISPTTDQPASGRVIWEIV